MSALSISSASASSGWAISLGASLATPCVASPPHPSPHIISVAHISGNSGDIHQQARAAGARARHMLPAAMVPLGLRRDSATGARPPHISPDPQLDERTAHPESVRGFKAAPSGVRAREYLVGILLRHSEGRALILAPESLPGWRSWVLHVLRSLGMQIASRRSEWEEENGSAGAGAAYDAHDDAVDLPTPSFSADRVVIRERYPLVRRTQSMPGPYSDRYPAVNSFRLVKHQFSPRPPRRRLGKSTSLPSDSRKGSNSTTDSSGVSRFDGSERSSGSSNPPVVLGTNPTMWPVPRPEPFLRIGGSVTWKTEWHPLGSFVGVANSELALQYSVWGAQIRLSLWEHVLKLRRELVEHHGEWFRYVSLSWLRAPHGI